MNETMTPPGSNPASKPTVEIVLCSYNGARFIAEQLASILAQSVRADRISIYDDGSSDDTIAVLTQFLDGLDPADRGLFQLSRNHANLGYSENFSQAIGRASGDILFLCDQDDVWEPNKVEALLAVLGEADMAFSDGVPIDAVGERLGSCSVLSLYGLSRAEIADFERQALRRLLKKNYINGAAVAIRREAAQIALPLPCDMPHDYWLALWCACHHSIRATPQMLYRYRQHDGNVIGMSAGNLLYEWLGIWRQPNRPRQRELTIWAAIVARLSASGEPAAEAAQAKLRWLSLVLDRKQGRLRRACRILVSALRGDYRRYSGGYALSRDIVSVLRGC